ncbi:uncharacterized protein LOC133843577 isoform X1 [Drosophila sulfurigaster albostrigata]|uniref:uncharacterized protein LOC133843577 isoform X1 n=1 Tax=Drosophila sulfurigaster albostrigata TaxID=89887 RepID=UPI002D21D726|nr:uncharacterized protein LOC133843577 isoform X1 [Drosophila sulfurigaster albostrigata]
MFASNSYNTRLPASSTMLKSLIMAENAAEESALEFYENCNLLWRAEFTDPTIASPGIGTQFQPLKKSRKEKSSAYGDTDSENNQNGNVSIGGILEFLPEIGSDFENVVPFVVETRH